MCGWFAVCVILIRAFQRVRGNMDLYLPVNEVEDLFGADGMQLYYVRNGIINHNAINFTAHVSETKKYMEFVWKAIDSDISVLYEMSFSTGNSDAIDVPRASINKSGSLPTQEDTFTIFVNCTGKKTDDVMIGVIFNFILADNPTEDITIKLKRLKRCMKYSQKSPNTNKNSSNHHNDHGVGESPLPPSEPADSGQSTYAFYISISVVIFIFVLVVVGFRICHNRTRAKRQMTEIDACMMNHISSIPHHNQFLRPDLPNNATIPQPGPGPSTSWMNFTPIINDLGTDIVDIRHKLSSIAVPKSDIVLEETLQEGTFSKIYRGTFEGNCLVLVKTVTQAASEEQTRLLLFESSIFKGMHHRNLLPIKCVVLDGPEPPLVIFPYTKGGNLKRYLRDIKLTDLNSFGSSSSSRTNYEQASTQDLVEMGMQVACGMTYLAKRGLVHKDLATRNCVIDENLKVKITDNALSRDLFPSDYCCLGDNENRPVRWLAMESLVHKVYSTASDVWSFGVLLWELQSLAATPYVDIDDFEMAAYLQDGFRLSQPINCPDHLYNIMAGCWHYSSDKRPTFSGLLQMLMEFNAELGEYV